MAARPGRRPQGPAVARSRASPRGSAQQAPLTPEYQAVLEASIADQAAGGPGNDPTYTCLAPGMPRVMIVYDPMEIIITPGTTHMLMGHIHDSRRIYTDGRDWAEEIEPTFQGHSIGRWIDSKFDGHYDQLLVETRAFKGPRVYDSTGLPLHQDNQTIIKERIYQDGADANLLHDELTTIDHALTRPWTVTKSYRRMQVARPAWREVDLRGGQPARQDRPGSLLPQRRRLSDADQEGSVAAGFEVFRQAAKVAVAADPVSGRAIACDEPSALCALPLRARGRACLGPRPEGRPAKRVGWGHATNTEFVGTRDPTAGAMIMAAYGRTADSICSV